MENLWNRHDADRWQQHNTDASNLALRTYTSRLLGANRDLVMHGGGNTSTKSEGEPDDQQLLLVKGSGWDLGTIEPKGFAPLKLDPLLEAYRGKRLSDLEMVELMGRCVTRPDAPSPSVETLLHAFLPYKFVDHTHAAAALVLANQPNAARIAESLDGPELAVVPYVMPGFDLAVEGRRIHDAHPGIEALWLVNHGLFTFGANAKDSYDATIALVTAAEAHLGEHNVSLTPPESTEPRSKAVNDLCSRIISALESKTIGSGTRFFCDFRATPSIRDYVSRDDIEEIACRGPITPDHVIRLKPFPIFLDIDASEDQIAHELEQFKQRYMKYFNRHAASATEQKTMLDTLPRQVIIRNTGMIGLGSSQATASVCGDLLEQNARVINAAESYGHFQPVTESELFDIEYWSLEQAKLGRK